MIQGQQDWLDHSEPVGEDWAKMTLWGVLLTRGGLETPEEYSPHFPTRHFSFHYYFLRFSLLIQLLNQSSSLLYLASRGKLHYRIPIPFLARKNYINSINESI